MPRSGWLKDPPAFTDLHAESDDTTRTLATAGAPPVADMLKELGLEVGADVQVGKRADLSPYFSTIEDQGDIGSCTAQVVAALGEYFQNRAFGTYTDLSRLFLYKATRNLLGWKGDTGAYLRTALGALVLIGAPPEHMWPYIERRFDVEPPAWLYAVAQNFKGTSYFHVDTPGMNKGDLLDRVRAFLANGIPCTAGFTVYASSNQASPENDGEIPFPARRDRVVDGHGVVIVGFDDERQITNQLPGGRTTIGAFKIRSSWGPNWGDRGYGWLPYEYLLTGICDDLWSLMKMEWIETGQFFYEEI